MYACIFLVDELKLLCNCFSFWNNIALLMYWILSLRALHVLKQWMVGLGIKKCFQMKFNMLETLQLWWYTVFSSGDCFYQSQNIFIIYFTEKIILDLTSFSLFSTFTLQISFIFKDDSKFKIVQLLIWSIKHFSIFTFFRFLDLFISCNIEINQTRKEKLKKKLFKNRKHLKLYIHLT